MANICENTLHVYSENSENLKYIESFFKDLPIILQENIKSVKKLSDNDLISIIALFNACIEK